jgi:hypothetical protein
MSVENLLSLQDTCLGNLKGRRIMFGRISQLQLATSSKKDCKLNAGDTAVNITPLIAVSALTSISSVTRGCILCLFFANKVLRVQKNDLMRTVIFHVLAIRHC